eukprot:GILI01025967.1.p1 GENE.GILI01025967.1~~GILI01025967.1.p1  ORF type:complete len:268 (-),score=55.07 GILI01025967.1:156-911(-)
MHKRLEVAGIIVETVPSAFDQEEYDLFLRYEKAVHKDKEWTPKRYTSFLVTTPLIPRPFENSAGTSHGYGSFHQRYRLPDGRLIAVGVVDILPSCLSSVYCFYDPDFFALSPGVFTALQEIKWVSEISQSEPSLKYYYLGYYIHTCPKMKYKGQYKPSDLRDLRTGKWVPLENCQSRLDKEKYPPLSDDPVLEPKHPNMRTLNSVPLLLGSDAAFLSDLNPRGKEIVKPLLEEFVEMVGQELSSQIKVKFN